MNIIVIRHGKVDMKWRRMSTSIQFDEDCAIVTHGFYMQTFVKRLKYHGFKIQKKRISYSNLDEIVAIR